MKVDRGLWVSIMGERYYYDSLIVWKASPLDQLSTFDYPAVQQRTTAYSSDGWLYMGYNMAGVYQDSIQFLDVPEESGGSLPLSIQFNPPLPNPFNSTVVMNYSLPRTSHASLRVYNITGRLTAVLTGGVQSAGEHRVTWRPDGTASGIYLVRLESSDGVQSRKVVYVK